MGAFHVYCVQSTVYVEPEDELADMDAAFDALSKTFGVVALSRAAACEKDEDAIAKLAIEYLRDDMLAAESFKVETKRSDKSFHHHKHPALPVRRRPPRRGVSRDARRRPRTRSSSSTSRCATMRPMSTRAPTQGAGGTARRLQRPGRDAALRRHRQPRLHLDDSPARRALHTRPLLLLPLHLRARPRRRSSSWRELLTPWCGPHVRCEVVPFTHIQEEIRDKCPEEYFTLIMRRFMMRIAERHRRAQRLQGHRHRREPRPGRQPDHGGHGLHAGRDRTCPFSSRSSAWTRRRSSRIARKIGTFETSILPYEDCCTVFTPAPPQDQAPPWRRSRPAESALGRRRAWCSEARGRHRKDMDRHMNAEIIAVGTELLLGNTINTDAADGRACCSRELRHQRLLADGRGRQPGPAS